MRNTTWQDRFPDLEALSSARSSSSSSSSSSSPPSPLLRCLLRVRSSNWMMTAIVLSILSIWAYYVMEFATQYRYDIISITTPQVAYNTADIPLPIAVDGRANSLKAAKEMMEEKEEEMELLRNDTTTADTATRSEQEVSNIEEGIVEPVSDNALNASSSTSLLSSHPPSAEDDLIKETVNVSGSAADNSTTTMFAPATDTETVVKEVEVPTVQILDELPDISSQPPIETMVEEATVEPFMLTPSHFVSGSPVGRVLILLSENRVKEFFYSPADPTPSPLLADPFFLDGIATHYIHYGLMHFFSYASLYGYDILNYRTPMPGPKRDYAWSKLSGLLDRNCSLLYQYDYILMLDVDVSIVDWTLSLEAGLRKFADGFMENDKEFILLNEDRGGWDGCNAGIIIVKTHRCSPEHHSLVRQLLYYWWDYPLTSTQVAHALEQWPAEQGIFNEYVLPRFKSHIRILRRFHNDNGPLYGPHASWFNHVTGGFDPRDRPAQVAFWKNMPLPHREKGRLTRTKTNEEKDNAMVNYPQIKRSLTQTNETLDHWQNTMRSECAALFPSKPPADSSMAYVLPPFSSLPPANDVSHTLGSVLVLFLQQSGVVLAEGNPPDPLLLDQLHLHWSYYTNLLYARCIGAAFKHHRMFLSYNEPMVHPFLQLFQARGEMFRGLLDEYDFIFLIDSRATIVKHQMTLQESLRKFAPTFLTNDADTILWGEDICNHNSAHTHDKNSRDNLLRRPSDAETFAIMKTHRSERSVFWRRRLIDYLDDPFQAKFAAPTTTTTSTADSNCGLAQPEWLMHVPDVVDTDVLPRLQWHFFQNVLACGQPKCRELYTAATFQCVDKSTTT